jgi:PPOX class probable F420-dependent enzyme
VHVKGSRVVREPGGRSILANDTDNANSSSVIAPRRLSWDTDAMTVIDEFLARRSRIAMLSSLRRDGRPLSVPVWFEWDGAQLRMFADATSPKIARLRHDPRVSVVIANESDESEFWVAFDGDARIEERGGLALAEQLAPKYWNLDDADQAAALAAWTQAGDEAFCLIVVEPTAIRSA